MIFGTLSQGSRFILSLGVGILIGLLFELTSLSRLFVRCRRLFTVIFDILFFLIATVTYISINYYTTGFDIEWYTVLGNLAGFVIERKSISILLANFFKMLYNLSIKKNNGRKSKV